MINKRMHGVGLIRLLAGVTLAQIPSRKGFVDSSFAGDEWFFYCDCWQAHKNGLFTTGDIKTLARINDQFVAPTWVRHGTAFKVPKADSEKPEAMK